MVIWGCGFQNNVISLLDHWPMSILVGNFIEYLIFWWPDMSIVQFLKGYPYSSL